MQKADKLRVEMATCAPEHECGEATIWREAGCPLAFRLAGLRRKGADVKPNSVGNSKSSCAVDRPLKSFDRWLKVRFLPIGAT
jgi:hypothetical protein